MRDQEELCTECGTRLPEGTRFCTNCGARMAGEAAQAQAASEQATRPTEMRQGSMQPPPPRRKRGLLVGGILGGVAVVAGVIALILFLTVFSGGGGAASSVDQPKGLANKYLAALQDKDSQSYMDCFNSDYFERINSFSEMLNINAQDLVDTIMDLATFKFGGVKLEVRSQTESEATVVTTAGKASFSAMGQRRDSDLSQDQLVFNMVKEDGRWYLTEDPMDSAGLSTDFSGGFGSGDWPVPGADDWPNQ